MTSPTQPHSAPRLPCVVHEDDQLLVVHKPAGWNTHAPAPHAGEGIFEWVRSQSPDLAHLAIIHRLDKETSGLLLFSKNPAANRPLHDQFATREVEKRYRLLTSKSPAWNERTIVSRIARIGERYASVQGAASKEAQHAETHFRVLERTPNHTLIEAEPLTGRTHQIRVHATDLHCPILGDTLYGGVPFPRVCLHAAELKLKHPASGAPIQWSAPVDFFAPPAPALRNACISPETTNAYRLVHGASDGWPGWLIERWGDFILAQTRDPAARPHWLRDLRQIAAAAPNSAADTPSAWTGLYVKPLQKQPGAAQVSDLSPKLLTGQTAPDFFLVRENNLQFEIRFHEGYSVGLFLDQRENRRRTLTRHIAPGFQLPSPASQPTPEILNCFAYTCGFSVAAAHAGFRTVSLDLSKKYLDWGRRNFTHNQLDPDAHEFLFGDCFDWLNRFRKRGRTFAAIFLDPPTFSRSRESGTFQVESGMAPLCENAAALLQPGGVLFASTNSATLPPQKFLDAVHLGIAKANRRIVQEHYQPQPPDFPITREEPAYLKTVWIQLA